MHAAAREPDRRLSVAPMMDYTDRHARFLLRLVSRHTLLYTEMVTAAALVHGDAGRLLAFDVAEHPVALQLGGADPAQMAAAARIGAQQGYDEININVGCPSERVQSGRFGACLMAEPATVADCVRAMRAETDVPITVKTRIGIDLQDSYETLCRFVDTVAEAGCRTFIVHARKAWLQGLSPKDNREIPPLDYARVHRLKRDRPALEIVINGGIRSLDEAGRELRLVDGAMIGRAVFDDLWLLADADRRIFDQREPRPERGRVIAAYAEYCERELARGVRLAQLTRPLMGLVHGLPGARQFRRRMSEDARRPAADSSLLLKAWHELTAGVSAPENGALPAAGELAAG
ncbi:tRNA dihydrouridine(20/20a) synthase DusA [Acidihalobacter ferrooxydans]|uniref:tRNA dihydrouridine(20/20a) synthase DusA n=1 Tax=Acidihalobacter ferrooxydans TaxID=1765967 RepID=UPI0012EBF5AC|nr:tRNA dihydrouridine(20/20a) synthase DusA [Acidihalobacter ferrooxydans]